jgi:hypothetical protein
MALLPFLAGCVIGYVGNSADVKRIRKLTEQREQERKRVEGLINASDEAVTGAGLRKFGVGTSEVGVLGSSPYN